MQDALGDYSQIEAVSGLLKEDLSLKDSEKLYDAYSALNIEGIKSWEDFILLNYDQRKLYLEFFRRYGPSYLIISYRFAWR